MRRPWPKWSSYRRRSALTFSVGYCIEIRCVCPSTLRGQVAESSALVGELEDLSALEKEYASDDLIYQAKIQVHKQFPTGR